MYNIKKQDKKMLRIISKLQSRYIYYKLIFISSKKEQAYLSIYTYLNYINVKKVRYSFKSYSK